ncbi:MAG: hypothetical protein Q9160_007560 [Pyrenula sp. 1 TL-2023]
MCTSDERPFADSYTLGSISAVVDALPSPGFGNANGAFTSGHEGLAVFVTSAEPSTENLFSARQGYHWKWEQGGTQPDATISFRFCQESTSSPLAKAQQPLSDGSIHTTEPEVDDKPGFNLSSQRDEQTESGGDISGNADGLGNPHSDTAQSSTAPSSGKGPEIQQSASAAKDATQHEAARHRHFLSFTEQYDLPLADTRFHNGKEYTMYNDAWNVTFNYESRTWDLELEKALPGRDNQSHLGITAEIESVNCKVPLIPITRSRKVVSVVGNVISQLSAEEETNGALPASTELEKAIPAFIEDERIQPGEQLQVFALVTPKERESPKQISLESSLRDRGSHLHRVTSGGGGWGKKAGLLSLDPRQTLDPQESNWSESNFISVGDSVQFLVSVNPESNDAEQQQQAFRKGYDLARDTTRPLVARPGEGCMLLGTICSEDDPRHNNVSLLSHIAKPKGHLAVFPGFFGMLTAKPMCMKNVVPPLGPARSGEQDVLPSTSILGMPFASVAIKLRHHTD